MAKITQCILFQQYKKKLSIVKKPSSSKRNSICHIYILQFVDTFRKSMNTGHTFDNHSRRKLSQGFLSEDLFVRNSVPTSEPLFQFVLPALMILFLY